MRLMEDSKVVRLAGMIHESLVNGPGLRRVFFAQGCAHNCEGCFNNESHSFERGKLENMDNLIGEIKNNPLINGVTFSGGDPLEQADKFAYMAGEIKRIGLNIWCYTGYTFEYIVEHQYERAGWHDLLKHIDVLVDGKFEEDKKSEKIKFRGSTNQRIIDVQESIRTGSVKLLDFDK